MTDKALPAIEDARRRYLAALARRISQKKFYPRTARRNGDEGKVVVGFTIESSGHLRHVRVIRSCGFPALDDAALKTVSRINPFRPLPKELAMTQWELAVPIAYSLKD